MAVKRGALIVIEGVDRSGKSTQCKKLVQTLKNKKYKVEGANFPDRATAIGGLINEYLTSKTQLSDQVIHLLFTANRWEKMEEIKKSLAQGVTWIVDRYTYSGIVFSSVKKNMSPTWCKMPESGLPRPDLTFLLMVDDETLADRPGFGDERYENNEFQLKVKNMFKQVYQTEPDWEMVDANRSVEEVHDDMLRAIEKVIEEVGDKPLKKFEFLNEK